MNERHTEWFGADLARGPFSASYMDTAAVQIATALAQLRTPVSRADADLLAHGDFIRQLADRIAPDYAAYVDMESTPEVSNDIRVDIRTALSSYSIFDCWLADTIGGGLSNYTGATVTFPTGTILQQIVTNRHFRVITSANGLLTVNINYTSTRNWYLAVARHGRVYYSSQLRFYA